MSYLSGGSATPTKEEDACPPKPCKPKTRCVKRRDIPPGCRKKPVCKPKPQCVRRAPKKKACKPRCVPRKKCQTDDGKMAPVRPRDLVPETVPDEVPEGDGSMSVGTSNVDFATQIGCNNPSSPNCPKNKKKRRKKCGSC